jgi:hypothetical protein
VIRIRKGGRAGLILNVRILFLEKDGLLMKKQFIMDQEGDIIISFVCS